MFAHESKPKVDSRAIRVLLPASRRAGPSASPAVAHSRVGGIGTLLQAKLKIGAVDDPLEREADRVADTVMGDRAANVRGATSDSPIQRACAACASGEGTCPTCDDESRQIQRKPLETSTVASGVEGHVGSALASGEPLRSSTRAFMEPRFGRDFSTVRVHAGPAASQAAAALGARAFTIGRSIVFGASEYAPETAAGQRLVAHELAHVVQQSSGTGATVQRQKKKGLGGPLDLQFDPCVTFEGRTVCGSDAAKLCSKIDLPGCGTICKLFGCDKPDTPKTKCPPGWRPATSTAFVGQCCPETSTVDSEQSCCPPQRIGFLDSRCCKPDEVVSDNRCKKQSDLPSGPTLLCPPPGKPTLLGGKCCFPPEVPHGLKDCAVPPPTPTPQPAPKPTPKLPESVEIFFQQDRPRPDEAAGALGSSTTSRGRANFDALVQKLKSDPSLVVQLVGRASPEGPKGSEETYNRDLGARRARTIAAALKAAGISESRLADPSESDLRAECEPITTGLVTCGMAGAVGDSDRQVLARVFSR